MIYPDCTGHMLMNLALFKPFGSELSKVNMEKPVLKLYVDICILNIRGQGQHRDHSERKGNE